MKYEGSTQICGALKWQQRFLREVQRGKDFRLCGGKIYKYGCFDDAVKRFDGKMLIDDSAKSSKGNYSNYMNELVLFILVIFTQTSFRYV